MVGVCSPFRLASLVTMCLMGSWAPTFAFGQVEPLAHPNHYVLLVDASFSTVESNAKSRAYHRLLHEELPSLLYENGFDKIPKIEPTKDELTLLNFGIVTDQYSAGEAYRVLDKFRFQSQFIHSVFLRRTDVSRELLQDELTPRQFFRMTVLSWSRELAFLALRDSASASVAQRTFLILLTDGRLNAGSAKSEILIASQRGNKEDIRAVTSFIREFQDNYVYLALGSDNPDNAAFSAKYDAGSGRRSAECEEDCFYLSVYEVVPAKWAQWQEKANGIVPFGSLDVSYEQESSVRPHAVIDPKLSQSFQNWLKEAPNREQEDSRWRVEGQSESATLNSGSSQLDLVLANPLKCGQQTFPLVADGSVRQSDPFLGVRAIHFAFPESMVGPEPESCRTANLLKTAGEFGALGIIVVLLGLYGYNRLWGNHIKVILPGILQSLPLHRRGTRTVNLLVLPQTHTPALEVQLPDPWLQQLFYPHAELEIAGNAALAVPWSHNQTTICNLPHRDHSQTLNAVWRQLPAEPASLALQLKNGRATGTLNVRFSHGWNSNEDTA